MDSDNRVVVKAKGGGVRVKVVKGVNGEKRSDAIFSTIKIL